MNIFRILCFIVFPLIRVQLLIDFLSQNYPLNYKRNRLRVLIRIYNGHYKSLAFWIPNLDILEQSFLNRL